MRKCERERERKPRKFKVVLRLRQIGGGERNPQTTTKKISERFSFGLDGFTKTVLAEKAPFTGEPLILRILCFKLFSLHTIKFIAWSPAIRRRPVGSAYWLPGTISRDHFRLLTLKPVLSTEYCLAVSQLLSLCLRLCGSRTFRSDLTVKRLAV